MSHLEQRGLKFAHPNRSKNGNFVESVTVEGTNYFVSVFREAEGKPLIEPEGYNPLILEKWGQLIGRMHSATKTFRLPPGAHPRPEWNEERNYLHIHRFIKKEDGGLYDRFQELDAWLRNLPKGKDEYGLIHADLHNGNFFVTAQNEITAFDFDDCHYQWFVYDIAVPAFFISYSLKLNGSDLTWEGLSDFFWKGYASTNRLSDFWIESVPRFIEYRAFVMYYWGVVNLQNNELSAKARDWIKNSVVYCRNEISARKSTA